MEDKVRFPAIGLMVVGGIGVLLALLRLAMSAFSVGLGGILGAQGGQSGQEQAILNMLSGGVGAIIGVFGLIVAGLTIYGGLKMYRFESYSLALTGAAISCVPCFGCCCVGVPVGIWALVVLSDQAVKDSFTS